MTAEVPNKKNKETSKFVPNETGSQNLFVWQFSNFRNIKNSAKNLSCREIRLNHKKVLVLIFWADFTEKLEFFFQFDIGYFHNFALNSGDLPLNKENLCDSSLAW